MLFIFVGFIFILCNIDLIVELMDENVAVLHGSEASKYVFKKLGIGHEFPEVEDVTHALDTGLFSFFVLLV